VSSLYSTSPWAACRTDREQATYSRQCFLTW
jgi:hypothetical protein